jgi:acetyl-CoA carboxylase biotin carboxylase subunit
MGQAAIAAAVAVGYRGAGTCEFLLDADGKYYFLEMNTRIQVEHPVTEAAYGVDLVREQLRIARGRGMSVSEWPLQPRGHAIECRITSEDPANGFLPSTGKITFLRVPSGPGVRWDSGIELGDEVGLHYDSLLGKLIVHAEDRASAIRRALRALDELVLAGVATNMGFFRRLLADSDFCQGEIDIQFLERRTDLIAPVQDVARDHRIAIAVALAEAERRAAASPVSSAAEAGSNGDAWMESVRLDALR